jgi:hypothetical protein
MLPRTHLPEPTRDGPVEVLPGMTVAGQTQRQSTFLVPRVFAAELSFARSLVPDDFEEKVVKLTKKEHMVILGSALHPKSICYLGIDLLFSRLSPRTIVQVVSILLLEKHCVLLAQSPYVLSLCVLCLRELCQPFKSRVMFLAVLPGGADYVGLLDSPVPFVCGIVKHMAMPAIPPHVVVVDLDRESVRDPESSPPMPRAEALAASLEELVARNRADIEIPLPKPARSREPSRTPPGRVFAPSAEESAPEPHNPLQEALDFVHKRVHHGVVGVHYLRYPRRFIFREALVRDILTQFRHHLPPTLEQLIRPCFITDTTDIEHPVTVFNREVFMASIDSAEQPFYDAFIGTTAFQEFADSKMDETAMTLSRSSFSSPCLVDDCRDVSASEPTDECDAVFTQDEAEGETDV